MILSYKNILLYSLQVNRRYGICNSRKLLTLKINAQGVNHKETRMRINAANKCFFALKTFLIPNLLSVRNNLTLYNVMRFTPSRNMHVQPGL